MSQRPTRHSPDLTVVAMIVVVPLVVLIGGYLLVLLVKHHPYLVMATLIGLFAGAMASLVVWWIMSLHREIVALQVKVFDQQIQIDTLRGHLRPSGEPQHRPGDSYPLGQG